MVPRSVFALVYSVFLTKVFFLGLNLSRTSPAADTIEPIGKKAGGKAGQQQLRKRRQFLDLNPVT
jgi:hypothetical protein